MIRNILIAVITTIVGDIVNRIMDKFTGDEEENGKSES